MSSSPLSLVPKSFVPESEIPRIGGPRLVPEIPTATPDGFSRPFRPAWDRGITKTPSIINALKTFSLELWALGGTSVAEAGALEIGATVGIGLAGGILIGLGINWAIGKACGKSLGEWIYDEMHPEENIPAYDPTLQSVQSESSQIDSPDKKIKPIEAPSKKSNPDLTSPVFSEPNIDTQLIPQENNWMTSINYTLKESEQFAKKSRVVSKEDQEELEKQQRALQMYNDPFYNPNGTISLDYFLMVVGAKSSGTGFQSDPINKSILTPQASTQASGSASTASGASRGGSRARKKAEAEKADTQTSFDVLYEEKVLEARDAGEEARNLILTSRNNFLVAKQWRKAFDLWHKLINNPVCSPQERLKSMIAAVDGYRVAKGQPSMVVSMCQVIRLEAKEQGYEFVQAEAAFILGLVISDRLGDGEDIKRGILYFEEAIDIFRKFEETQNHEAVALFWLAYLCNAYASQEIPEIAKVYTANAIEAYENFYSLLDNADPNLIDPERYAAGPINYLKALQDMGQLNGLSVVIEQFLKYYTRQGYSLEKAGDVVYLDLWPNIKGVGEEVDEIEPDIKFIRNIRKLNALKKAFHENGCEKIAQKLEREITDLLKILLAYADSSAEEGHIEDAVSAYRILKASYGELGDVDQVAHLQALITLFQVPSPPKSQKPKEPIIFN